jgi:hypothetical protein
MMEKSMYSIEDFSAFLGNGNADEKYKYVGVKFNPFPRSGTANINDNDIHNSASKGAQHIVNGFF